MTRKWLLTVVGAVAVAALLVAAQMLTSAPGTSAPSGSSGTAATSSVAAVDVSGTVASQPGDGSQTASGAATAARPRIVLPISGVEPIEPRGPIPEGEPLAPLSSTPPGVLSAYAEGVIPAGSAYRVSVRPWGYCTPAAGGPTVLVTVDSVSALAGAPARGDMKGRLVLAVMVADSGRLMLSGGAYHAKLTFVAEGDRLVPEIGQVATAAD